MECRARIRAVAEEQFATRGLAATSLRSIAAELGWTAASLYRYFRNKSELLALTRAAAHDRFSDRVEAAYASTTDLWDRSRAVGQAYVDFAFDEPHAYQLRDHPRLVLLHRQLVGGCRGVVGALPIAAVRGRPAQAASALRRG